MLLLQIIEGDVKRDAGVVVIASHLRVEEDRLQAVLVADEGLHEAAIGFLVTEDEGRALAAFLVMGDAVPDEFEAGEEGFGLDPVRGGDHAPKRARDDRVVHHGIRGQIPLLLHVTEQVIDEQGSGFVPGEAFIGPLA